MFLMEMCLLKRILTVMARGMHCNCSIQWGIFRKNKGYLKDDSSLFQYS